MVLSMRARSRCRRSSERLSSRAESEADISLSRYAQRKVPSEPNTPGIQRLLDREYTGLPAAGRPSLRNWPERHYPLENE